MTSISSLDTTTQTSQVQQHRHRGNDGMDKAMQAVADKLGISTDDLKAARKDGKTIADLAQEKGVSVDDIKSTLAQSLKENAPAGAPSDIDFSQMASDIVDGKRPQGGHGPGGRPPQNGSGENTSSNSLQSLLESAGVNSDELVELLSNKSADSSSTTSAYGATSSSDSSDFVSQLKSLISQYGSKGLSYDTSL
jgi:hypothetical protein